MLNKLDQEPTDEPTAPQKLADLEIFERLCQQHLPDFPSASMSLEACLTLLHNRCIYFNRSLVRTYIAHLEQAGESNIQQKPASIFFARLAKQIQILRLMTGQGNNLLREQEERT